VPVQAPASALVGPSVAVRGFDAGVSGSLDAGGAGRVSENTCDFMGKLEVYPWNHTFRLFNWFWPILTKQDKMSKNN